MIFFCKISGFYCHSFCHRFCSLTRTYLQVSAHIHIFRSMCLMFTDEQDHLCQCRRQGTLPITAHMFSFTADNGLVWDLPLIPFRNRCCLGSFVSLFCLTPLSVLSKILSFHGSLVFLSCIF